MEINIGWFKETFSKSSFIGKSSEDLRRFMGIGLLKPVAYHINQERDNIYVLTRDGELFYQERC
mgnify:CR=1 FL=1